MPQTGWVGAGQFFMRGEEGAIQIDTQTYGILL